MSDLQNRTAAQLKEQAGLEEEARLGPGYAWYKLGWMNREERRRFERANPHLKQTPPPARKEPLS